MFFANGIFTLSYYYKFNINLYDNFNTFFIKTGFYDFKLITTI